MIYTLLNENLLSVPRHWSRHIPEGAALEAEWNAKFAEYEKKYKEDAAVLKSIINGDLPAGWEKALPVSKFTFFRLFMIFTHVIFHGLEHVFPNRS